MAGPTNADGSYSPDAARAALTLPTVAPVIVNPLVSSTEFGGLNFRFGHKITTVVGTVPTIADLEASPLKPPDKATSFSTYGVTIPISSGDRRMPGNVVSSSEIQSEMKGTYDYYVTYQVPTTTTDEAYGSLTLSPDTDQNPALGLDITETSKTTDTTRVFQNNDDTSDNWVDVERYHTITLINDQGIARTYTFQLD